MTTATEKKELTIKDVKSSTVELAETLKKEITLGDDGVGSVPADLYTRSLPEGITEETVKSLQKHDTAFVAAATLAFGEVATDLLKKHKKLNVASLEIATVAHDKIKLGYERHTSRPNPRDATQTVETYGRTSVSFDQYADRGGSGDLSKVRKIINARAKAAFGK